jgi:hypothetical protein
MAGHSRLKDGVASRAYVPAIHVLDCIEKDVDARHKAGHDEREIRIRNQVAERRMRTPWR